MDFPSTFVEKVGASAEEVQARGESEADARKTKITQRINCSID